jgi:hypothetical protein
MQKIREKKKKIVVGTYPVGSEITTVIFNQNFA